MQEKVFNSDRGEKWWHLWRLSKECTLLQDCMAAAIKACPAHARAAGVSAAHQLIVVEVLSIGMKLVMNDLYSPNAAKTWLKVRIYN